MGQVMANIEFRCRLPYQLLIPMSPRGAPCPRCGQEMDRWGDHAVQCRVGRGVAVTFRHNAVRDLLFRIGMEVAAVGTREPPLPVRVVGFESHGPDLVFLDWDGGWDLYVDVMGTSPLAASYWSGGGGGGVVPGGVAARAAAGKLASYRKVLLRQPPRVVFRPLAFETFGGSDTDAEEFLKRLQGLVNQALVAHEDLVWISTHRRDAFGRGTREWLHTHFPHLTMATIPVDVITTWDVTGMTWDDVITTWDVSGMTWDDVITTWDVTS
eukprot:jgi/Botrbrau1/15979/Bobra.0375s0004.1